ncbi:hypothetical protein NEFER03_2010 [Nematocida sp. LUAm3]|nr:hypothetical protein NEFER03_2010 [Nematocida sp. LUAm3]KAI5174484.1 hypothetical protein NEFER02_0605 [Nematocida sp. LUAm2]KAI5179135.1 hypothetical protein NEFER01_1998 [Nematocida sp. LUAm1]
MKKESKRRSAWEKVRRAGVFTLAFFLLASGYVCASSMSRTDQLYLQLEEKTINNSMDSLFKVLSFSSALRTTIRERKQQEEELKEGSSKKVYINNEDPELYKRSSERSSIYVVEYEETNLMVRKNMLGNMGWAKLKDVLGLVKSISCFSINIRISKREESISLEFISLLMSKMHCYEIYIVFETEYSKIYMHEAAIHQERFFDPKSLYGMAERKVKLEIYTTRGIEFICNMFSKDSVYFLKIQNLHLSDMYREIRSLNFSPNCSIIIDNVSCAPGEKKENKLYLPTAIDTCSHLTIRSLTHAELDAANLYTFISGNHLTTLSIPWAIVEELSYISRSQRTLLRVFLLMLYDVQYCIEYLYEELSSGNRPWLEADSVMLCLHENSPCNREKDLSSLYKGYILRNRGIITKNCNVDDSNVRNNIFYTLSTLGKIGEVLGDLNTHSCQNVEHLYVPDLLHITIPLNDISLQPSIKSILEKHKSHGEMFCQRLMCDTLIFDGGKLSCSDRCIDNLTSILDFLGNIHANSILFLGVTADERHAPKKLQVNMMHRIYAHKISLRNTSSAVLNILLTKYIYMFGTELEIDQDCVSDAKVFDLLFEPRNMNITKIRLYIPGDLLAYIKRSDFEQHREEKWTVLQRNYKEQTITLNKLCSLFHSDIEGILQKTIKLTVLLPCELPENVQDIFPKLKSVSKKPKTSYNKPNLPTILMFSLPEGYKYRVDKKMIYLLIESISPYFQNISSFSIHNARICEKTYFSLIRSKNEFLNFNQISKIELSNLSVETKNFIIMESLKENASSLCIYNSNFSRSIFVYENSLSSSLDLQNEAVIVSKALIVQMVGVCSDIMMTPSGSTHPFIVMMQNRKKGIFKLLWSLLSTRNAEIQCSLCSGKKNIPDAHREDFLVLNCGHYAHVHCIHTFVQQKRSAQPLAKQSKTTALSTHRELNVFTCECKQTLLSLCVIRLVSWESMLSSENILECLYVRSLSNIWYWSSKNSLLYLWQILYNEDIIYKTKPVSNEIKLVLS